MNGLLARSSPAVLALLALLAHPAAAKPSFPWPDFDALAARFPGVGAVCLVDETNASLGGPRRRRVRQARVRAFRRRGARPRPRVRLARPHGLRHRVAPRAEDRGPHVDRARQEHRSAEVAHLRRRQLPRLRIVPGHQGQALRVPRRRRAHRARAAHHRAGPLGLHGRPPVRAHDPDARVAGDPDRSALVVRRRLQPDRARPGRRGRAVARNPEWPRTARSCA
jgi:hypothetical protein